MSSVRCLTDDTYVLYAAKHYDNPSCVSMDEFYSDLNRITYIKRLLIKYETTGNIRERLLINHMILLYNVFGAEAATRLLFDRIDEKFHSCIKTFVYFLDRLPNSIPGHDLQNIEIDLYVEKVLRNI